MTEMICITCPMGCHLSIERLSENDIAVTGNRCARGEQYAREEMLSPRRVVTATCKVQESPGVKSLVKQVSDSTQGTSMCQQNGLYLPRRVPVRSTAAFPREKIVDLLAIIYTLKVELPVKRGEVLLANALGTGIDIVVARSM